MKLQLKIITAGVLFSVAASAFCASDISAPMNTPGGDFTSSASMELADVLTAGRAEIALGYGENTALQNVAMLAQSGISNIAYIDQTGSGNFTAVVQDTANGTSNGNAAIAFQSGTGNRAMINQH